MPAGCQERVRRGKMKTNTILMVVAGALFITVLLMAGCTQSPGTVPPVTTPVLPINRTLNESREGASNFTPVSIPSTTPPLQTKTTIAPVINTTTAIKNADPTDVSEITFMRYSDDDYSVDYPSTWTVKNSLYTPYFCDNTVDVSSPAYHLCYENETKMIGPFFFYDDNNYNKLSRVVTFTRGDGKVKFVSFTKDFAGPNIGNSVLKPTDEWCKAEFQLNFPDLAPSNFVGNYKYFATGNTMASTYDTVMPNGSKYYPYPLAFTKKDIITTHHWYSVGFITDYENFNKYRDLRDFIISSVTTKDSA
jgi:hypothetical protein